MAIFPTLIEKRSRTLSSGSLDVFSDFWYGATGGPTKSGATVSEKSAFKYLTVARCVMLISADIAGLPLVLYRKLPGGGKEPAFDHHLYDILHDAPNPETNSFLWRESGNSHIELWGNHFSTIRRNIYTGDIIGLWQIEDPGKVQIKRVNGKIEYRWRDDAGQHVKNSSEMFHVPGFGFNGLTGMSVISTIRESVGLGLANDEFAARYFGDGMHIGGVMDVPHDLGEQKEEYLAALKKQHAGMQKSHGVLLTQNGEKYTQLSMPLRDAQFLEGREFQKAEIAGFYGVPGHKVGIYKQNTNRNNTEQENQGYLDSCLIHRIRRYETCISQQLLSKEDRKAGIFAEFNVAGLLRADAAARAEYYNKMFQVAGIKPNEIRAKENMNPIDGGDQSFVMLNMIPLDMTGDMAAPSKPEEKSIREKRSVVARDRIAKQYFPLFHRAAEKIVTLEANAIKRKVDKFRKQRAVGDMKTWLDNFYRDMPEKIKGEIGPVFRSFSDAIISESIAEIGADPEKVQLERFISDYIDTYAARHSSSSLGQMVALLDDELDALSERAGEWEETRADKIARNETVRMSNAVFQAVAFAVGLGTVWRIRGAETCPYCKEFNGKRVRSGGSFVE
jgi:HK97 family phage portal protein